LLFYNIIKGGREEAREEIGREEAREGDREGANTLVLLMSWSENYTAAMLFFILNIPISGISMSMFYPALH